MEWSQLVSLQIERLYSFSLWIEWSSRLFISGFGGFFKMQCGYRWNFWRVRSSLLTKVEVVVFASLYCRFEMITWS